MKVLVGTLCQQSMVYSQFMLSVLEVYQRSIEHKQIEANRIINEIPNFDRNNPEHRARFDHEMYRRTVDVALYTLGGESLLSRGRNHMAQVCLTQGFDKMFFIDADEGFSWEQFVTIACSPYPVAAGLVPLKTYPVPGTFQTSLNFLPFLEDEKYFDNALRTLTSTVKMAQDKNTPWVKVAYTGTGFLCLDASVLAALAEKAEEYIYPNPHTQQPEVHWSFFDGGPMHGQYMSEDWALCEKIRALGIDIMINANVRVSHTGPHTFHAA